MIGRTTTKLIGRTELQPRLQDKCSLLVSLANSYCLKEGTCIHAPLLKLGLQDSLYLNNNLLSLYGKCFGVHFARKLFDEMPHRDIVSFTGLMSAYINEQRGEEALNIFQWMVISGPTSNAFTFSNVLRTCSAIGEFEYGRRVHASIIKNRFGLNPVLGTALIDFYTKFEDMEEACKIFGFFKAGDVVLWTMMVSALVNVGKWGPALRLYTDMIRSGVTPNGFTFVKALTASAILGLKYGKLLHGHMVVLGVELNLVVKTALVDMYLRCERMEDAIKVSKLTPEWDVWLWTVIVSGLAKNCKLKEVVQALREMEVDGFSPGNVVFLSILNACSMVSLLGLGRQIHSRVVTSGLEDDVPVGNALIDMYMKCSDMVEDGLRVFREIKSPDVISWTSFISGYARHGFHQECLNSYKEMRASGVQPNSYALSTILRTCSIMKCRSETLKVHGHIIKTQAHNDIVVCNALVDSYAGSGTSDEAWNVVKSMNDKDAITYTSFITRLNQTGHHELALKIMIEMVDNDVKMDAYTLASFLSASAALGALKTGQLLHCHSVKSGLLSCISVLNGLVNFYGKLGLLHDAHSSFLEIYDPDVISWNALMSGLSANGHVFSTLSAFEDMRMSGINPDSVTYLLVLFTCSHGGLVDMGLEYFKSMQEMHGIEPQLDHYVQLVDLLGRAGQLEEALGVVETMPFIPNALIFKTMLAHCSFHKNLLLGEDMARRGLSLDPSDRTFHQLLASLYDKAGLSDLGENTRKLIREGAGKEMMNGV